MTRRATLTPWDHVVLSCFTYSLIAWGITGWIAIFPGDANWRAWGAIYTGHLWALGGLWWARRWARSHLW